MAAAAVQTPQRNPPGAYMMTPALPRQQSSSTPQRTSIFQNATTPQPPSQQQQQQQQQSQPAQSGTVTYPQLNPTARDAGNPANDLTLAERASRNVNACLDSESRYPPIDGYISQGSSSDYDIPSSPAWAPFQKTKLYDIPEQIFEQYNQAQVSTMMGLFADINHAWVSIDNSLYLWNYTLPNPEIFGFEEQPNSITTVRLVNPRPAVFKPNIKKLLLVATTADVYLIGVAYASAQDSAASIALYQTKMQVPVRGLGVQSIAASDRTGRIFFTSRESDDVYEILYQPEEKWFQSRCSKVIHTKTALQTILPANPFGHKAPQENITQLAVDDSRNILYALGSRSSLRAFYMRTWTTLELCMSKSQPTILYDLRHKVAENPLISQDMALVSITPIAAEEGQRLNLMALTSTGCRIYFSAIFGSYWSYDTKGPMSSMQVHHVRFPPQVSSQTAQTQYSGSMQAMTYPGQAAANTSRALALSTIGDRFPPGYFVCHVQRESDTRNLLFLSAPDAGRIYHSQDAATGYGFIESGSFLTLDSHVEDIGLCRGRFAASSNPTGFGNELAVQFDKPVTELAVLTNAGIHTFRRRRLVDVFATGVKYGTSEDSGETLMAKFVRIYGRAETIATAVAVACGQASDVLGDARVTKITDPEVLEYARRAFIEQGGRPIVNENVAADMNAIPIEHVRPSPRHQGLSLYVSRLLRSIWKAAVVVESSNPAGALQVIPGAPIEKLQDVQRDLTRLQEFLKSNKSMIDGLTGPEALGRATTKQEEAALQGEHRALTSLIRLVSDVAEGIAFVLVLFDEHVNEIILSLPEISRQQIRQMSFEQLFCSARGKDLAKDLVKAVVNRNIAQGSNVDTVTDALRRRCGSFCSADDCVIFKAQEQLKKASEAGTSTDLSRKLLNESLRLLQKVAASLSLEQLRWAVEQYIALQFFAGAIQLSLSVAHEHDRGNAALAWANEGRPGQDHREAAHTLRTQCYEFIHYIIEAVDRAAAAAPELVDGYPTATTKRKHEAYDVINSSDDELFQTNLYDWYLSMGWSARLLDVRSTHVINYLRRKADEDVRHADLLWQYYKHYSSFFEAAKVQLTLAKSAFQLNLNQRIEYLASSRANASIRGSGPSAVASVDNARKVKHESLGEISDLLDLANVQADILERMKTEPRLAQARREQVLARLDGPVLPIDVLYNEFTDQAGYHDLSLLIYSVADHRVASDIRNTWNNLVESAHTDAAQSPNNAGTPPFEMVGETVRGLAYRLERSEIFFPTPHIYALLDKYSATYPLQPKPPKHWTVSLFLDAEVAYERIVKAIELSLYSDPEASISFSWPDNERGQGQRRGPRHAQEQRFQRVASDLVQVVKGWFDRTRGMGQRGVFGGQKEAVWVLDVLRECAEEGERGQLLSEDVMERLVQLRAAAGRLIP